MTRPIYLAQGEARCLGSHCKHPQPCARKEAPPQTGRPLGDFSLPSHTLWVPVDCAAPHWARFISLADAVEPAQQQQTKEWIGG